MSRSLSVVLVVTLLNLGCSTARQSYAPDSNGECPAPSWYDSHGNCVDTPEDGISGEETGGHQALRITGLVLLYTVAGVLVVAYVALVVLAEAGQTSSVVVPRGSTVVVVR